MCIVLFVGLSVIRVHPGLIKMRELESLLTRLRQALLDMLSPATTHPTADWLDWEERFHAVFLYLHQCGLLAHTQVDPNGLLCPNSTMSLSAEEAQQIPDQLFRTKLDELTYGNINNVEGMKNRAKLLMERLKDVQAMPIVPKNEPPINDFTILRQFYRGTVQ